MTGIVREYLLRLSLGERRHALEAMQDLAWEFDPRTMLHHSEAPPTKAKTKERRDTLKDIIGYFSDLENSPSTLKEILLNVGACRRTVLRILYANTGTVFEKAGTAERYDKGRREDLWRLKPSSEVTTR